jgi:hypothetical protein
MGIPVNLLAFVFYVSYYLTLREPTNEVQNLVTPKRITATTH